MRPGAKGKVDTFKMQDTDPDQEDGTGRRTKKFVIINWRDILNPKAGGAERYCYEMASRLAEDGVKVTWISSGFSGGPRREVYNGIEIVRVGNIFTVYFAMVLEFFRARKKAYVFESVNAIPFLSGLFSRKSKTVMIHHLMPYSVFREKLGFMAPFAYFLQNVINPALYRKARVITNSESTKKDLVDQGYRDVHIVKTGVSPGFYNPSIKMEYLVAPGPLRPWKNHKDIILALARLPEKYHLFIFGIPETGDYEDRLKRLSKTMGLGERVHFLGRITEEEKYKLFSISKLSICASVKEGWGLSNMEAQAFGCPVIAYDVPGVRDSVVNNITGRLVQYGSISAIASNAEELLANETILTSYSERATKWAKNFSWDQCYGEFLGATLKYMRSVEREDHSGLLDRLSWLRAR
ncbi:MAG: glycosyltransferase family 4 protein [Thermoplasmataceae archaeon]